jgi:hypothetical protein
MRICVVLAALAAGLVVGCTDEITVHTETTCPSGANYPGGIAGLVVPADSGLVNASGSRGDFAAQIGSDGYFILEDVPAGVYALVVSPTHYSRRELSDVIVDPGETTNLHEVTLATMPYPVYRTRPADGEEGFASNRLALYVDEPLDLETLAEETTFDPAAEGTWESQPGLCRFLFSENLRVGTTYQVTIDAAARTAAGEPLGSVLQLSFSTRPLSVSVSYPQTAPGGRVPLSGFYVHVGFNEYIGFEALLTAISFEPEIQGIWVPSDPSISPTDPTLYQYFTFLAYDDELSPLSTYTLTISDEVELLDGVRLPAPSQTIFTTGSHGVISVSPRNGTAGVPPGVTVRLTFSTPMDTASVESAFTLAEMEGDPVPGAFAWYSAYAELVFRPHEELRVGGVYRVALSTAATTATGMNLAEPFESYFSVD